VEKINCGLKAQKRLLECFYGVPPVFWGLVGEGLGRYCFQVRFFGVGLIDGKVSRKGEVGRRKKRDRRVAVSDFVVFRMAKFGA